MRCSPFTTCDKPLRSIYDTASNGYWFSVIDLCAILTDSDYKAARNYWKSFKHKINHKSDQVVTESNHLKWEAPNGKYHFTEAIDFKTLIYLIQICPSPKANLYRLWLADMLLEGIPVKELEMELAKLGEESAELIMKKYKTDTDKPYGRVTTRRREIPL